MYLFIYILEILFFIFNKNYLIIFENKIIFYISVTKIKL